MEAFATLSPDGARQEMQPAGKRVKRDAHPLVNAVLAAHAGQPCAALTCVWRSLQKSDARAAIRQHLQQVHRGNVSARKTAVAEELSALKDGLVLQDMVPDCC